MVLFLFFCSGISNTIFYDPAATRRLICSLSSIFLFRSRGEIPCVDSKIYCKFGNFSDFTFSRSFPNYAIEPDVVSSPSPG